ncbi:MAG: NAD(P)H-dependent glycerol-3-phosphate dehydrogenase, partial [Verrucomicrobia bacterium]|nr:NAD(P)H-dependent glycerol-3-phosphate dehydrogenase [Verrucomicrobiota bacterium]
MKIAYLGTGAWGFCLARLLAAKGYTVSAWSNVPSQIEELTKARVHPYLPGRPISDTATFTTDLALALKDAHIIVESVTSAGIRPVFEQVGAVGIPTTTPIVMTSKGIEQKSGLILSEVVTSVLGEPYQNSIASLSGPSFAEEVSNGLPTSVVCASYSEEIATLAADLFTTPFLRVYPNSDIRGVSFGGALKNIIAIACGISDGLELGTGAKATLMTRGLHEIAKLARLQRCRPETLYGLSGMGDLFL